MSKFDWSMTRGTKDQTAYRLNRQDRSLERAATQDIKFSPDGSLCIIVGYQPPEAQNGETKFGYAIYRVKGDSLEFLDGMLYDIERR